MTGLEACIVPVRSHPVTAGLQSRQCGAAIPSAAQGELAPRFPPAGGLFYARVAAIAS